MKVNSLKYENVRLWKAGKDAMPALCIFYWGKWKLWGKELCKKINKPCESILLKTVYKKVYDGTTFGFPAKYRDS